MLKAIHYAKVELIPGIICDGYVLENETAVMSERGTAALLNLNQAALNRMITKGLPKSISPYIDIDLLTQVEAVEVEAKNSPYQGRKITVYNSYIIESMIRGYALALAAHTLKSNQRHIGDRCVTLLCSFVRTALEAAIKEACGFDSQIQKSHQNHYTTAIDLISEFGFRCSIQNDIATKKDITNFLSVPAGTLNSFLYKHNEIKPIKLDYATIQRAGGKARRMNGYHVKDVVKIVFGMDTAIGIELKQRMFGEISTLSKLHSKDEIQWRKIFSKVFSGYDLRFNHSIGSHRLRVDFFVPDLLLCMECNGYSHRNYNPEWEVQREKIITKKYALVRFHRETPLECIFNAILQAKPGKVVRLYSDQKVSLTKFLSHN
ncbi:hypothetical protein [Candidatus Uabimicrobium amorphum]|uniref:DUF559 domain-containing protein n=1 Tax=Uabimicrobium amorphum TaxID=2596890 RepID=A0A5S9F5P5_UABAM|nr:hypothetical protein [Candidatus Uabimicrobium amorphum]BBM86343.1 hypothetical protein UABAM_04729 [Candidatus Uabimicrobium amorphum]